MALVKCKECGSDVSEKALSCPKCGATLRKPKRGFFGKIFKYSFIGFNILMLLWFIGGMSAASETINSASNEYEEAGAALGTGLGAMMILTLWAVGDVILGLFVLFTRPK
jgi:hypothetical protein